MLGSAYGKDSLVTAEGFMDGEIRDRGADPVLDDLLDRTRHYSFFQVLRVLGRIFGRDGDGSPGLRIRSHLSLGFPGSGVESLDQDEQGDITLLTNILTLYGSGSPLPTFYSEDLFPGEDQADHPVRSVIDVVNQRLHTLLYKGWQRSQSVIRVVEAGDRELARRFSNLMGLDESRPIRSFKHPGMLLRYSGLFAMTVRSASGLETLLSDALSVPVRIEQMIERRIPIPHDQRARLGENVRLGMDACLGKKARDTGGAFRIHVGPLSTGDYLRLVPGTDDHDLLQALTALYLSTPLAWDVELTMAEHEKARTVCLGRRPFARLGLDTWIFSGKGPDTFRTRFTSKEM